MMKFKFRYIERYCPSSGEYGEYEFNDLTSFRPIFGQIWTEDGERVYGGFGLVGNW